MRVLKKHGISVPQGLKAFDELPLIMVVGNDGDLKKRLWEDGRLGNCEVIPVAMAFEAGVKVHAKFSGYDGNGERIGAVDG